MRVVVTGVPLGSGGKQKPVKIAHLDVEDGTWQTWHNLGGYYITEVYVDATSTESTDEIADVVALRSVEDA